MAKLILNKDVPVRLSNKPEAVEVGRLPKGKPLKRLRWNGRQLKDLMHVNHIWVAPDLSLHIKDVGNCVKIAMNYSRKKDLILDNGVPRLRTTEEKQSIKNFEKNEKKRSKIRTRIKKEYDSKLDYEIARDKCLWATIDYLLNNNTDHIQYVRNNLDKVKSILGIN